MDAPDPILPQISLWPSLLWMVALVVVGVATVIHAARRARWGWVTALVLAAPLAIPLYWLLGVPSRETRQRRGQPLTP